MELKDYREVYNSLVLSEEADKRILDGINKKGGRTMKRKYYKPAWKAGRIVAALAAVAVTGTAVYAATQMWDSNVARETGVSDNPEIRDKMSEKGYSQYLGDDKTNYSVTDKDITVSVIQTLADRYCADIYFEVDFGSKYITSGKYLDFGGTEVEIANVLPEIVLKCNGKVLDAALLNGVSKIINNHKAAYRYQAGYTDREEIPEGAEITMEISAFTVYKDDKEFFALYKASESETEDGRMDAYENWDRTLATVQGNWMLEWKLSYGTERRIYDLDYKTRAMDMDFKIKELDISPLSCSILLEEDGWTANERRQFKKRHKNNAGITFILNGITLGHQKFIPHDGVCHLNVGENEDGKLFIREGGQFGRILDLEKVTGISVSNGIVEYISFKDAIKELED